MRKKLFKRLLGVTAIAAAGALAVLPGTASAAPTGAPPQWRAGKIDLVRFSGSETSYYVMTRISNLYNQTSIFGCTLQAVDRRTCNLGADTAATDILDNYDRDEITQGAGIGSSGGVGQLCGSIPTGGLPVDAARSSRPKGGSDCATSTFLGFMKDGLVGVTFPLEVPPAGATRGPVAAGWRPGDPVNGPYSGTPFNNISNVGGTSSIAYRIFCDNGATAINDWGQLTDPGQPVGSGAPIGVPIVIWGTNTLSGTYASWNSYIGCDQNLKATAAHIIQESNAPQIREIVEAENPANPVAQYEAVTAALYNGSYGVLSSNPYSRSGGSLTRINGTVASPLSIQLGTLATARTVYNVYRTDTVRGSTAGFLNWICSTNDADHDINKTTGKNYNQEITNAINTTFGFVRTSCPIINAVADPAS